MCVFDWNDPYNYDAERDLLVTAGYLAMLPPGQTGRRRRPVRLFVHPSVTKLVYAIF